MMNLYDYFPPSESCSCQICLNYCKRPGWWTLEEFEYLLKTHYYKKVMLEISPEMSFGVLVPAFKGCESNFALQNYANNGCTFLNMNKCQLHKSKYQPLECRYCHHDRVGKGIECHNALEKEWNSFEGQKLVNYWLRIVNFPYKSYYYTLIQNMVLV